ncbi:oxidoreductase [Mycobacterium phage Leopard]|nr:oxidoreductase [Mycobacterium phage Leopard]
MDEAWMALSPLRPRTVMKSVAILGCGPSGLMAAHAGMLSGWNVAIYSRKVKSELHGAQYLHQPIPGLPCGSPKLVRYFLRGTPEDYRRKVYGDTWDGTVSPEDFEENHDAWDLRLAYEHLWETWEYDIRPIDIKWSADGGLPKHLSKYDMVISTVPRTVWDSDPNHFESTLIWAKGDRVGRIGQEDNTIECNAEPNVAWYRSAKIFGHSTFEWPWRAHYQGQDVPPMAGAVKVRKPLRYTGEDHTGFIHLGRYGAWEKGVLTSDTFFEAMKAFANDTIG